MADCVCVECNGLRFSVADEWLPVTPHNSIDSMVVSNVYDRLTLEPAIAVNSLADDGSDEFPFGQGGGSCSDSE